MKIKVLLSILLVVVLISGAGCFKKTETEKIETTNEEKTAQEANQAVVKEGKLIKNFFEVTRGLDAGRNTYYYYAINPSNGMKIEASSENNFKVEVMSEEDCIKKTKGLTYDTVVKEESVKSFEYSSEDKDISSDAKKKWCVAIINIDTKYSRIKTKIDELSY